MEGFCQGSSAKLDTSPFVCLRALSRVCKVPEVRDDDGEDGDSCLDAGEVDAGSFAVGIPHPKAKKSSKPGKGFPHGENNSTPSVGLCLSRVLVGALRLIFVIAQPSWGVHCLVFPGFRRSVVLLN